MRILLEDGTVIDPNKTMVCLIFSEADKHNIVNMPKENFRYTIAGDNVDAQRLWALSNKAKEFVGHKD